MYIQFVCIYIHANYVFIYTYAIVKELTASSSGFAAWLQAMGSSRAVATSPVSSQAPFAATARPSERFRLLSSIPPSPQSVPSKGEPSFATPLPHGQLHQDCG